MDEKTQKILKKFEKAAINKVHDENVILADRMANIIGVLLDIKPACIVDFFISKFNEKEAELMEKLVKDLELSCVIERNLVTLNPGEKTELRTFYISKKLENAELLASVEHEMEQQFRENFQDPYKIKECHRRIGRILGYPETAIEFFLIRWDKIVAKEYTAEEADKESKKYFHFIHSELNAEEEFEEYDRPIHEAMEQYIPTLTKIFRDEFPEKRWN